MHLVSDPAKYQQAVRERGELPFYHTACGSAEPVAQLTSDPAQVKCPLCQRLIAEFMASQTAEQSSSPEVPPNGSGTPLAPEDLDDSVFADVDELEATFGLTPPDESLPPQDSDSATTTDVTSVLAGLQPVLAPLFEVMEPVPEWSRWALEPEQDSAPLCALDVDLDLDLRTLLEPDEAEFLRRLASLSDMIGLQDLSSRVLSIVHRLTTEQAMLMDAMEDDEDDSETEADKE